MKYKKSYYLKLAIVNMLTSVRLIGSFILPFVYMFKGPVVVSIWVLIIFSTDAIDGKLSRLWHVQTFFGSLLDGVCDKLFSIVSLAILSYIRSIMLIPLILEVAIVCVNIIAYKDNKNVQSSKLGKRKTILLAITIILGFIITASPLYLEYLANNVKILFELYNNSLIYVLAGIIIGTQLLVLTDYSKKAFSKENIKIIKGKKLISLKEFKDILFDTEFYIKNKDKPLREIAYKK